MSLLGVKWLRPRLRAAMEAELEAFRATAGPKGVPLEDAVSEFRGGGTGKQKAKEKQREQEAGAVGATSKGKARPVPRTMPALRARGSVAEADRSPVGVGPFRGAVATLRGPRQGEAQLGVRSSRGTCRPPGGCPGVWLVTTSWSCAEPCARRRARGVGRGRSARRSAS